MANYVPANEDFAYSSMDVDIPLPPPNSPNASSTTDIEILNQRAYTRMSPLTPRKRGHNPAPPSGMTINYEDDLPTPKRIKAHKWFNPFGIDPFTMGYPCKQLEEAYWTEREQNRRYPITRYHMRIDTYMVNFRMIDEKMRARQLRAIKEKASIRPLPPQPIPAESAQSANVIPPYQNIKFVHAFQNVLRDQDSRTARLLTVDDLSEPTDQQTVRVYLETYVLVRKPHLMRRARTGTEVWTKPNYNQYELNLLDLQKVLVMWLILRTGLYPLIKMSLDIPDLFDFIATMDEDFEDEFDETESDCTMTFIRELQTGVKEVRDILHCEIFDPINGHNQENYDIGGIDEVMNGVTRDFLAECRRLARFLQKYKNLLGLKNGEAGADLDTMLEDDDDAVWEDGDDLCSEYLGMHSDEIRDWLSGAVTDTDN